MEGWSEFKRRKRAPLTELQTKSTKHAIRAGVKIAMGTDAGVGPPHGQNLRELQYLVEAGMTPMQAIQAGTKEGAELLGWQEDVGTLEKGKYADIVIAKGNPVEDITLLGNPENILVVIKGGKVVKDRR